MIAIVAAGMVNCSEWSAPQYRDRMPIMMADRSMTKRVNILTYIFLSVFIWGLRSPGSDLLEFADVLSLIAATRPTSVL